MRFHHSIALQFLVVVWFIRSPIHTKIALKLAMFTAVFLAMMSAGLAHAELTIWQVENNPPGTDAGNEWLTLINTGEYGTFTGYELKTTNGRIATHAVPTITLDTCEYHLITFRGQAIDNRDDTVRLLMDGVNVYETPVIKDTRNDDRFWTNPDVAALCGVPRESGSAGHEPLTEAEKDQRIRELEAENARLKAAIRLLHEAISDILAMLNGLLSVG